MYTESNCTLVNDFSVLSIMQQPPFKTSWSHSPLYFGHCLPCPIRLTLGNGKKSGLFAKRVQTSKCHSASGVTLAAVCVINSLYDCLSHRHAKANISALGLQGHPAYITVFGGHPQCPEGTVPKSRPSEIISIRLLSPQSWFGDTYPRHGVQWPRSEPGCCKAAL